MNDLRQAAQQALECLKGVARGKYDGNAAEVCAALRAALAQQAEPVEQMPVGWLESPHGAFRADPLYKMQFPSQLLQWQIALYTTPFQRKPLTEGALMGVYIDFDRTADTAWSGVEYLLRLCRAVERAHGITDPQVADRLARHGIPMPDDENPSFG